MARKSTHGLNVRDTWAWHFIENERRAARGDQPWTDEEITDLMRAAFKGKTPDSWDRVGMFRSQYNKAKHSFDGLPKAGEVPGRPVSFSYDEEGNRSVRKSRSDAGGSSNLDVEALRAIIQKEMEEARPRITVQFPDESEIEVPAGNSHKALPDVLERIAAGVPILLVGPSGSGKTYLAAQVAEALGRPFSFNSMSEGVSEASLLGRMLPREDGTWEYQESPFVKAFRDGGVHLLDELDAADPNLLVTVNAAIANGLLSLPFAGMEPIKRHPKCVLIAAANTYGNGASRQYVGRNQLDAATVNRFTMGTVEMDYDRDLEQAIASGILGKDRGQKLLDWAWKVREAIERNRMTRILSTRNIEDAARLMKVGKTLTQVGTILTQGWTDDEKAKVA